MLALVQASKRTTLLRGDFGETYTTPTGCGFPLYLVWWNNQLYPGRSSNLIIKGHLLPLWEVGDGSSVSGVALAYWGIAVMPRLLDDIPSKPDLETMVQVKQFIQEVILGHAGKQERKAEKVSLLWAAGAQSQWGYLERLQSIFYYSEG